MTVDMAKCCLSKWDGDEANCQMCNDLLIGRRTRWCSSTCSQLYQRQHRYSLARAACRRRARAKCDCPPEVFRPPGSKRRSPKHAVCSACGRCEPQLLAADLGRLECNHIEPVLGRPRTWTCLNHETNLEMLCHDCHLRVTRSQRHLWPKASQEKWTEEKIAARDAARKAKRAKTKHLKTTKPGRNVDRPVKRSARRRIA